MKFSDRLAQLGSARPHLPVEQAAVDPSQDPLAQVRAQLARLMGKTEATPPVEPRAHADEFAELPFRRVETALGPIFQREERMGLTKCVGQVDINLAQHADTDLLSLLALDPTLASCDVGRALFIDTETTGLGGAGTLAFLVGLAYREPDGHWVMEQLLLRHPGEEGALLGRVAELVAQCSLLVSFNGRSFDWPLLQSRRVMNQLGTQAAPPHLDLLHVARRIHKRRLGRCRLVDLEHEVLGFLRGEDDISGADIAPRYHHFLRTGDEAALSAIVEHNAWDVMSMVALVALYGQSFSTPHVEDLCGVTETLLRAKDYERAEVWAEHVMEAGAPQQGLLLRAKVRKARGDVARALLDFEALAQELDDAAVRLILAKLHEHSTRNLERALFFAQQGTTEDEARQHARTDRLSRKLSQPKSSTPRHPSSPRSNKRSRS